MFPQMTAFFAQVDNDAAGKGLMASLGAMMFIYLAVIALVVVSMWMIFAKAGQPGWAAIVPFYNIWVLVEICGKEPVWFVLMLIPCINIFASILLTVELAKVFGKDAGFAIGLILLPFVFYPMLAFGSARYQRAQQ